ncbi:hypothetical protein ABZ826_20230 [Streptomyces sp. NPDC047515]|uniref:hypothetical protein n=1 Tax=Streptomyces sp. NPDC047515 TaxID=3155380 RepID=UPI0033C10FD3
MTVLSELTGDEMNGTVSSVSEEPASASGTAGGADGAATGVSYRITVKPDRSLPLKLAGQDVRLTIAAASSKGKVLAVPASALSSSLDGGTSVTVLTADNKRRQVRVRTGSNGDGLVQVIPLDGSALSEGDQVVVGVRNGRTTRTGP